MTDGRECVSPQPRGESADSPPCGLLRSARLMPVLATAAILFLIFAFFRALMLLMVMQRIGNVPPGDLFNCFYIGLRYDAMPIGYVLLPYVLVLALSPQKAFTSKAFQRFLAAYPTCVIVLTLLEEIVGLAFFLQMGVRLNWMTFGYLANYTEVMTYLWRNYPLWAMPLLLAGVTVGLYLFFRSRYARAPQKNMPVWIRLVLACVLAGLCVLAARGTLENHPLRRTKAYFSANNIINQVTLNNWVTLFTAARLQISDTQQEKSLFPLLKVEEAVQVTRVLLVQPHETPLDIMGNPLWRRADTGTAMRDWNVVVIVMEGMSGAPVGALGGSPSYTPNFDALCREGLFFDQAYAVGAHTSRGLVATLCGHPDVAGTTVMKRDRAVGKFLTLPAIFQSRGYRTLFVYGGDPNFDNMKEFFEAGGIDRFVGQDDMNSTEPGNWGVPDEVMLRKAHETFVSMGDQKFFSVVLTVSNHPPYEVPAGLAGLLPVDPQHEENGWLNGYIYSDWALGEFFRLAKTAPYFRRTIFVLVADHGHKMDPALWLDVEGYRVPLLIYAPELVPAGRVKTVASQMDVPSTVLGLLGGSYEHCFLGRDLLRVKDEGFAVLHEDDRLGFVRGEGALVLRPDRDPSMYVLSGRIMAEVPRQRCNPDAMQAMTRQILAFYTTALDLYRNQSFRKGGAEGD